MFHRGAVQALVPDEPQVRARLTALVRKELDPARQRAVAGRSVPLPPPADPRRRLRALPKATRAELHERFADWLEEHASGLVELDEILGYHLEQAARYTTWSSARPGAQLGPGSGAAERLGTGGLARRSIGATCGSARALLGPRPRRSRAVRRGPG